MKYINTKEEIERAIQEEKVIIKFETDWCRPCIMVTEQVKLLEKSRNDIQVYAVNITDNIDYFMNEYNITSVPTLLYCHKGQILNRSIGFATKQMMIKTLDNGIESMLE